ncbi:MAG: hypothetical protein ABI862_18560 [Ilumatobacteraceae bacterium]
MIRVEIALAGDDELVAVADRPTSLWVHEAGTAEELLARRSRPND